MIKTFRGQLADGGQDKIRLKTNKGEVGYRIVKFEGFPNLPGTTNLESTLQIWKVRQSSISISTATVDFSDQTLLGALYYGLSADVSYGPAFSSIFEREIFNQDIYITHTETMAAVAFNYYIELEQVMLNDNQTTMATLQSLRQIAEK